MSNIENIFNENVFINLLQVFTPGFIVIQIINWTHKQHKYDVTITVLLSCVIGYAINITIIPIALKFVTVSQSVVICILSSVILGTVFGWLRNCKYVNRITTKLFYKTTNTFFEDSLNFKKGSNVQIVLKSGKTIFGQVKFLDSTDNPNWILVSLDNIKYKLSHKTVDATVESIIVPVNEIEYIEVT